jgi:hypothetical protein
LGEPIVAKLRLSCSDARTHAPLPGVAVALHRPTGVLNGQPVALGSASTDALGRADLPLPGTPGPGADLSLTKAGYCSRSVYVELQPAD